jgi:hypothetical protein
MDSGGVLLERRKAESEPEHDVQQVDHDRREERELELASLTVG